MLSTRVYSCPGCEKRMKSTSRFTNHINACTSQFIQQVLLIRMQSEQNTLIPGKDDDASENFGPHKDEESILKEQKIEGDHRDLVGESLDTGSRAKDGLSRHTPQTGLLASESSSSLREVRFSEQEFPAGKPVSNIKYHHLGSQNNNPFYPLNNQLDYVLANYFAESETIKSNVNRFLSNLLMAPLTKKLSY